MRLLPTIRHQICRQKTAWQGTHQWTLSHGVAFHSSQALLRYILEITNDRFITAKKEFVKDEGMMDDDDDDDDDNSIRLIEIFPF